MLSISTVFVAPAPADRGSGDDERRARSRGRALRSHRRVPPRWLVRAALNLSDGGAQTAIKSGAARRRTSSVVLGRPPAITCSSATRSSSTPWSCADRNPALAVEHLAGGERLRVERRRGEDDRAAARLRALDRAPRAFVRKVTSGALVAVEAEVVAPVGAGRPGRRSRPRRSRRGDRDRPASPSRRREATATTTMIAASDHRGADRDQRSAARAATAGSIALTLSRRPATGGGRRNAKIRPGD